MKLKIPALALLCLAALSFQSKEDKPNILFIVLDDAGLDMSAYDRTWVHTPAFDQIAANGILFERGYTPNAKCAPSRASILTGRNPWQLDAACNHNIYFPSQFKTYPEVLAENGYRIGYTGKGYAPGKAFYADGSKRQLLGPAWSTHKLTPPTRFISNNDYQQNFKDFLNENSGEPWCFWVGFTEPHRFYEFGSGQKLGGKNPAQIEDVPGYWPDVDSVRQDMLDYAYEIEYADAQVNEILKELKAKGQLDNTLIIYTSDHGMPFPRVKGNQYEDANHVPLAISWPVGMKARGRRVRDFVSFTDLAPTVLQAAGVDWQQSGMHPAAGKSLFAQFQSDKDGQIEPERDYMLVGQERHDFGRPGDVGYPIRGLHKEGFLFLKNYETDRWPVCNPETGYLNCDGGATKTYVLNQRRRGETRFYWEMDFGKRPAYELYDLSVDSHCLHNLADNPDHKKRLQAMEREMELRLRSQNDLRMIGYGHLYEQYPFADVNGFYERFMKGEKIPTGWVNASDYELEEVE